MIELHFYVDADLKYPYVKPANPDAKKFWKLFNYLPDNSAYLDEQRIANLRDMNYSVWIRDEGSPLMLAREITV